MVVNGATKFGDMKHFSAQLEAFLAGGSGREVSFKYDHDANLVALQGPAAPAVLARLVAKPDVERVRTMRFMTGGP
jgi:aminomethyltransferase